MNKIICFSSTRWDFLFQRPQQLMTTFSRDFKIAYVNPPMKAGEKCLQNFNFDDWCRSINRNLTVFTPPRPKLSGLKIQTHFTDLMKKFIRHFGFDDAILWFNMPEAEYLCRNLNEKLVIYDCLDDFSSFSWTPKYSAEADLILAKKADIVLVVSESLYQSKAAYNSNCFLIPNGCDFPHFSRAANNNLKFPNDLKNMKKPLIGFIGALYEWIDFDLLGFLGRERPYWSIVLIGPKQAGIKTVKLPNIHYLGRRSYGILPNYLKQFDVGIIPFRRSKTGTSSSPIKFYEYLAAALPIVSTEIPEVVKFGKIVEIAHNNKDFLDKTERLLLEREDEKDRRRALQLSLARANTWESRCNSVKKILEKFSRQ